ncbi:Uncharacterised protein [Alistipes finegoldii]|nr:Uncharacterised protein [Alistipes finegoldii]
MSPNQNTGCKSRFFHVLHIFRLFIVPLCRIKHAHDHYRRFQRPGAFRADARRSPRQGIRDAHRNPEAHHPPPAHKTQRHHRAIADRHGQNRGLRTADTPDPRTRPRADTGHHPRTDTRTRTPGGRRTALLQPRKTALDHGHLRRCGDERTAAAPCQRHRHRRRDTGARARPHPPRHDETGKRPLPRARRSRRDAQHGLRRGRRRDHEPHQRRAARAALLGHDARAHHPAFENLHARHGDRARGTQANHGRPHGTNLFRGTRGRQVRRPDPHHRRRTRILRHHLRPHQDRRRRNRLAPDGARLRSRGAARRRVAGAAREDTPQIPRPHDQYPGGYRRGRPGHRRGQPDPRHQLLAAAGLGELRAPHWPHGPRRQAGNGHHVRLALGVPRPEQPDARHQGRDQTRNPPLAAGHRRDETAEDQGGDAGDRRKRKLRRLQGIRRRAARRIYPRRSPGCAAAPGVPQRARPEQLPRNTLLLGRPQGDGTAVPGRGQTRRLHGTQAGRHAQIQMRPARQIYQRRPDFGQLLVRERPVPRCRGGRPQTQPAEPRPPADGRDRPRRGKRGAGSPGSQAPPHKNRGLPGRRADIRPGTEKADAEREAGNARPGNPDGVRPGARPRRNGTRRTLTRPNGI